MITKVQPKPRYEYTTEHWTWDELNKLERIAAKFMDEWGRYYEMPFGRLIEWQDEPWAKRILDDLPTKVYNELADGDAQLFIDVQDPE